MSPTVHGVACSGLFVPPSQSCHGTAVLIFVTPRETYTKVQCFHKPTSGTAAAKRPLYDGNVLGVQGKKHTHAHFGTWPLLCGVHAPAVGACKRSFHVLKVGLFLRDDFRPKKTPLLWIGVAIQ